MKCEFVVVSPEQQPQQCCKDADFLAHKTALCEAHLEVVNKGGWLSRPGEIRPVRP
jgi:hypothetical protein